MKKIFLFLTLTITLVGCSKVENVLDKAESIPGKMDNLNTNMGEMLESVRLQKLALSEERFYDEENHKFITPIPGDLLAPADTFAKTLTAEKAVKWIDLRIKKINKYQFGDAHPDATDENRAELEAKFNRAKMIDVLIISLVSGLMEPQLIDEIVATYVRPAHSSYRTVGLAILALRSHFFENVRLNGSLFTSNVSSLGLIQDGINYISELEKIGAYSFVQHIGVKFEGFSQEEYNQAFSIKFDSSKIASFWNLLQQRALDDYELVSYQQNEADQKNDLETQKSEFVRLIKIIETKTKTAVDQSLIDQALKKN